MAVLVLRLAAPLQAWGDGSRFLTRQTRKEPTKSGLVGLMASALGRSRDETIDDLAALEVAVRVDKPGELVRDFHSACVSGQKNSMISNRFYLADAVFVAAIGGDDALVCRIADAINSPHWPLFLGRRSCPPDLPLFLELKKDDFDVRKVLERVPWQAPDWYKARCCPRELDVVCDGRDGEMCEARSDHPISFDFTVKRQYGMRPVFSYRMGNPSYAKAEDHGVDGHDPMDF